MSCGDVHRCEGHVHYLCLQLTCNNEPGETASSKGLRKQSWREGGNHLKASSSASENRLNSQPELCYRSGSML